ncbi:MAG: DUF481 domain-containing protein [Gemmatimonadota bacterium]|nr:DUF481 domain-containing protein [Gemmatimonadota bacterium]MDP6528217.1 DUF481 domain-containing protein [Gemmatimonadota bacterium]MDP6803102.1 DUF481 domain-containing protein [Gemmatimonadota bacterium]MDP7031859.1 DUF481 domain-containing protein [Gemmatimonadota bacterium]
MIRTCALAVTLCGLVVLPVRAEILDTVSGGAPVDSGYAAQVEGRLGATGGNSDLTDLSLSGTVTWREGRDAVRMMAAADFAVSGGETVRNASMGHLRHNRDFADRFASVLFAQIQRDPMQSLTVRFLLGAGVRFDVLREDRRTLSVGLTPMLETDRIEDGGQDTIVRVSSFCRAEVPLGERATLDGTVFLQPGAADPGDARGMLSASVRSPLSERLSLVLRLKMAWDSEPPPDVESTDWNLRAGFAFRM